ncbi:hypothetical protein DC522_30870 [Microvirga sp. KLBC 81]|uniref:DUF4142 domain-containing protein n=1 Tax=Microvirga sp. KLBC 81 TaxID=1862707 RepID=UPI000D50BB64|nr:DUF4142 domain-containing protein [Microvirga sp. KLBC 81]PVE20689.1 hypothetical protein DC522_30870 [Microvirga sp. KLBC 81]
MMTLKSLVMAFVLGAALVGTLPAAWAQGQGASGVPAQTRTIDPEEFLRLAYSSATLQGQAAKLASSRETKPEVRSYATAAADFRLGLLQRIETFARERRMTLPSVKEFEHQVIIENLEPLDYLALSRRYAEIQIQALDQELGIYRTASQSAHQEVKSFAEQVLPELQKQREEAQKMYDAVGRP